MRASALALIVCATLVCASCASLHFEPRDDGSGTFHSTALAFTFLGRDYPQSAVLLARANASDAQLPSLLVTEETVFPYLWRLDFLLDVISIRWASVRGTYGPAN